VNAITWFGHSTTVVEIDEVRFVTDPVLRRRIAHLSRAEAVPRAALGRLDVVFVSHVHLDHLDLSSLVQIERSLTIVVPRGAGRMVRRRGFADVVEAAAGDELRFGGVRLDVTHAEHGVVRRHLWGRSSALGFVVRGSRSAYFAGDTDLFDAMRELAPVDVALLPIGGWGPRVPEGHLNPERAAAALRLVRPRTVVPVHWGTFRTPFAAPPDDGPAREFVRRAAEVAPQVDVRVLHIGETFDF
jgi:L-ascorbate metabolism protein UlaG (beta-lactamase superfamily)